MCSPWNLPWVRICDSPTPINELINSKYRNRKNSWKMVTWWIKKQLLFGTTVWSHIYLLDAIKYLSTVIWRGIPHCCWHMHNNITLYSTVRSEYSAWRFAFTILLYCFTVLNLGNNLHILSKFNVNELGSH